MIHEKTYHIDEKIIRSLGLQPHKEPIGLQLTNNTRVYKFSRLENVFIMESDLYGNPLPEGSCFLAVKGKRGLLGRPLRLEKLRNCSEGEIRKMAQNISEG